MEILIWKLENVERGYGGERDCCGMDMTVDVLALCAAGLEL